eukprot:scaffold32292_cov71-Phaeocystis_antarctica.AAC.8
MARQNWVRNSSSVASIERRTQLSPATPECLARGSGSGSVSSARPGVARQPEKADRRSSRRARSWQCEARRRAVRQAQGDVTAGRRGRARGHIDLEFNSTQSLPDEGQPSSSIGDTTKTVALHTQRDRCRVENFGPFTVLGSIRP